MSEQLLYRATPADLEIRSDGRTVVGIAVPFDSPADVQDPDGSRYREVFRKGSFARTIKERGPEKVKFLVNHESRQRLPIGRAIALREAAAGLYAELRVSKTRDGDESLELIRDGALDGLSIGFVPIPSGTRKNRDLTERLEVRLNEISAVAFAAYAEAAILGVRSAHRTLSHDAALARLRLLQRNPTP